MLIVVTEDDRLLLHHRDDIPDILHPDCWAGFGGALGEGETVHEALRREMREETGLEVHEPVELCREIDREGNSDRVHLFYVHGGIDIENIDLNEGAGVGVFTMRQALDLKLSPFVRRAIEGHLLPRLARNPTSVSSSRIARHRSDG